MGFDETKLRGGFYTNWIGDAQMYIRQRSQHDRGAVLTIPVNPSYSVRVVDLLTRLQHRLTNC